MAQVLKLKRTAVSGKVPSTSQLELGELAINTYDGRIFFEKDNGTASISELLIVNTSTPVTGSLNLNGNITATNITLSGDLIVQGTTTTINSTNLNIGDNIIELNYGGSSTTGGIYVKDATGASTTSGSLLWDATNDYWKIGKVGSESQVITISNLVSNLPTGVISGSSQITITESQISDLTHYTDSDVKTKLNSEGVISGSSQITITESQISDLTHTEIPNGTISGSSQLNGSTLSNMTVSGSFSGSFVGDGSGLTNLPLVIGIDEATTVTASYSNSDDITVTHNFNTYNILIQVFDDNRNVIIPSNISLPTLNTANITLSAPKSGYVVVAKGGHLISGSLISEDSSLLNGQSGSYYLDWVNFNNIPNGIVSSSSQTISHLNGTGIISSSAQIDSDLFNIDGLISGSSQLDNSTIDGVTLTNTTITGSFQPSGHVIPSENITYDLGSPTNRFRDLYLSNNSIFFEYSSISVNTGSGDFEIKDVNNDPAKIKVESFSIAPSGSSTQTFISQGPQGGVTFLSISDTQMVTYRIDNYDLQSSVTFSYIDSDGNPQTVSVPANTSFYELDAQEGSVTRTGGTDKYRIKLLRVPDGTPTAQVEVASLIVSSSEGSVTIQSGQSGSIILPRLIISGSNGQSTLSNDYSGGLAVLNNDETLGKIRVTELELVDSTKGNIINLVTVSGSLTTTANDSSGNSINPPSSNLSGSFTGSFTLTGDVVTTADCVKIGTIANPICEIHGTDIFGNISSTNGVISGSSQITDLTTYTEDVSGTANYTITHNLNEEYPIVQAWNTSTKRQEVPAIIESVSANVFDIEFASVFSGRIIVKK